MHCTADIEYNSEGAQGDIGSPFLLKRTNLSPQMRLSFSLQSNPGFSSSSFTSDVENNQVVGTTETLLQSSVEALRITPTEATATHTDTTAAATATAPPTGATTGATTTPTDAPETTATLLQSSTDNRMTNAWTEATTDTTAEEATSGEAFTELQSSTWNRRF